MLSYSRDDHMCTAASQSTTQSIVKREPHFFESLLHSEEFNVENFQPPYTEMMEEKSAFLWRNSINFTIYLSRF